ncbi:helix-turn-helix domain-containing protein [Haloferax sp. MBLA0076]|uniref:Helix-turn-helix domain-containing protein n=1 Tax=Haloferax litoreum TaxID=2666140 RepID=A0A6A8GKP7_9EURY|nr:MULTISPECIES: helix-turn-helix transcriptional regulator [Haloferax]KAB1190390.1 helix-turn-helix transcriptional regulator [Haloferax sp. CBA1148]MRX23361.1 helix-turn-helix domain-containing protein [Haloferax litoreum]
MNNALRTHREQRNLTQGELASLVDVTRQTINSIERGRYNPSLELALKLAREFECSVGDLFWLESGE